MQSYNKYIGRYLESKTCIRTLSQLQVLVLKMAYLPEERRSPFTPPADGQDRLSALPTEILLNIYDYLLPFHVNNRELEENFAKDFSREGRFPSHLPCPAHPLLALASTSEFHRAGLNEYALDVFRQWKHLNHHYRTRKQRWTHLESMTRKSNIGELIRLCGRFCVHCGRKTSSGWGRSQYVSSFASCCWKYGPVLVGNPKCTQLDCRYMLS